MIVCVMLVVMFILNDTIKTEEHVAKYLDAPTLAVVPYIKGKERKKEEILKLRDEKAKKEAKSKKEVKTKKEVKEAKNEK